MPLVKQFGEEAVWKAGFVALEFPATLVSHKFEFDKIEQELRKRKKHGEI